MLVVAPTFKPIDMPRNNTLDCDIWSVPMQEISWRQWHAKLASNTVDKVVSVGICTLGCYTELKISIFPINIIVWIPARC